MKLKHASNSYAGMRMRPLDWQFYFGFVAPAFLLMMIFMVLPIGFSLVYSLMKWNGASPPVFIGLNNYISMFNNRNFWQSFKNTWVLIAMALTIKIPLGCLLAFIMTKIRTGFRIYRSIFFFPAILAPIVIGLLFKQIYNGNYGVLNVIMTSLGLENYIRSWLSDPSTVIYAVSFPHVYQYIGTFFLIFLAAFQTVPTEVIESSKIDGASSSRTLFSIMLPMVRNVIMVCLVLGITGAIKLFDHPWIITGGGPGHDSSTLAVYMYREAFVSVRFGYGSAVTIIIVALALLVTLALRKSLVVFGGDD